MVGMTTSIKMTLRQIDMANKTQSLAAVGNLVPPGSYQFRVSKLIDFVEAELKRLHKQTSALYRKYGVLTKDEKGTNVYTLAGVDVAKVDEFNLELEKLLDEEISIPYEPIVYTRLGPGEISDQSCPHCQKQIQVPARKLTMHEVRFLGPLLVEDEAALVALVGGPELVPVPPPAQPK